jgi:SAM-dependent methyltransferase
MSELAASGRRNADVVWHDLECGAYTRDLPVWERLAGQSADPVLELGCGTGRVALHLARRGHEMVGVDRDPPLVAELSERAARDRLGASAEVADVTSFDLGNRSFGLAIAPIQLIQLLGGREERQRCLRLVAQHLSPGGRVALAIATSDAVAIGTAPPLPDVREVEGWIYSSLPLAVREVDGGIVVTRLRQIVSPEGVLSEQRSDIRLDSLSADEAELEAELCGLSAAGRIAVPPTPDHVGSTIVIAEAR